MNNQRQLALGFIMFSDDHTGKFPWQLFVTNGVFPYYQSVATCLHGTQATYFFTCPTDKAKHAATNFAQLGDDNISYFLSMDSRTNGAFILSGDRHLEAQGKPVGSGAFIYATNMVLNWTRELHGQVKNGPVGGLSFTDGHVEFAHTDRLNPLFQNQHLAVDHLAIP